MALPKAFWLLWFGQTFSRLGTLAPAFLILYLKQDSIVDAHTTPLIVGLFGVGIVLSGLVGGAVADLIGARRTIVAAQPLTAVTALALGLTTNLYAACALSLVAGFLSAVDRPAGAGLIAELVPQDQFAKAYSLYMVGFNVGMTLSPVISGVLLTWYPPALFWIWALCCVIYAALVWRLPADAVRQAGRPRGSSALRSALKGIAEPFHSPVLVAFLTLTFLLACIYLQVNSALPLDMRDAGLSPGGIGFVLAVNAVLSVALLPLSPRLVKGLPDHVPLILASALWAIGFGLNAFAHGMTGFIVATVVWTLGEVVWAPMSATFIANRSPAGRASTYQGSYFFAWNAAFVVGGPAGLAVANSYGYGSLWSATFLLGAVVALAFFFITRLPGFALADDLAKPGPEAELTLTSPQSSQGAES
ncbi:MFS family permease [Streptacidiphilus sp. BW17]|uniref:MFS transporter n=1 Tax=Streptacidiphilus sp. BW17 TaxID=3156274 RepID=UPI003513F895